MRAVLLENERFFDEIWRHESIVFFFCIVVFVTKYGHEKSDFLIKNQKEG